MGVWRSVDARPRVRVARSASDWAAEGLALAGVLTALVATALAWRALPATIPTHFGVSGAVDAWGPKTTLLALPTVAVFLYLMLSLVARAPHLMNLPVPVTEENAPRLYRAGQSLLIWLKAEIVWLFAYLLLMTVRIAHGGAPTLGVWLLPTVLVLIFGALAVGLLAIIRAR